MPHLWMFLLQSLTPPGHEDEFHNYARGAWFTLPEIFLDR